MVFDLRSDTVTRPTPAMLDAMHSAKVGDDVFEEDPSINALEAKAAALFGMEAAIFCPSGTMTNQIAIKVHSSPPGEVICDKMSHIYHYEGGGIGFNSGLSVKLLDGKRGRLTASLVEGAINDDNVHFPESQLVALENTCNKGGGSVYETETIQSISDLCRDRGLPLHLDGARLFNAMAVNGSTPEFYGHHFDTISICLSKGLGCPVGSLLLGSGKLIKKARRIRKVLGGGMRQGGFLAAAGNYALDHHVERLNEDHLRASQLGEILEQCEFVSEVSPVESNIVLFKLRSAGSGNDFVADMTNSDLLAIHLGNDQIRLVTHLDFGDNGLAYARQFFTQYRV